ncbi:hypothetical protein F2Q69_00011589 [Brassica cretica]|uniref:Uncharacterized protein n=1 Tax=Brassica cretica TaxID=69181 RepID=A0A8S9QIX8_BRACR|nr:hypothetical protein F2Q69_00011589 [Brassica cretica]
MEGKELLKSGLRVQIGNGEETLIWRDVWLPTHPPRAPRGQASGDVQKSSTKLQKYPEVFILRS